MVAKDPYGNPINNAGTPEPQPYARFTGQKFFGANGVTDAPADWQGAHYKWKNYNFYSPDGTPPKGQTKGGGLIKFDETSTAYTPSGVAPMAQVQAQTQTQTQAQPGLVPSAAGWPQPQTINAVAPAMGSAAMGAAMPQALTPNALMEMNRYQDRRQPMMPLQGYQNALLRGF